MSYLLLTALNLIAGINALIKILPPANQAVQKQKSLDALRPNIIQHFELQDKQNCAKAVFGLNRPRLEAVACPAKRCKEGRAMTLGVGIGIRVGF
jgi:hypothetical protein